MAPHGHHGAGVRSAPHSILGYRNTIGKTHKRVAEIPCGTAVETASNIELSLATFDDYVVIGGDHTITYGILRALKPKHGKPFLVMFDAHSDEYTHKEEMDCGNWLRFAKEEGLVKGVRWYGYRDREWVNEFNTRDIPKNGHIHITVDIDALDPKEYGYATTYNEIGGMKLKKLVKEIRLIANSTKASITADLVEYDPYRDATGAGRHACSVILDTLLDVITA